MGDSDEMNLKSEKDSSVYFFSKEDETVRHPCFKHVFKGRCGGGTMTCGLDSGCKPLKSGYHTCICRYDGLEVGDGYTCSKKRHGANAHDDHEDCINTHVDGKPIQLHFPAVTVKPSEPGVYRKTSNFYKGERTSASFPSSRTTMTFSERTTSTVDLTKELSTSLINMVTTAIPSPIINPNTTSSPPARRVQSIDDANTVATHQTTNLHGQARPLNSSTYSLTDGLTMVAILAPVAVLLALLVFMAGKYRGRKKSKRKARTIRALKLLQQEYPQSPSVIESLLQPEAMVRNFMYDPEHAILPSSASRTCFPFASHVRCLREKSIVIAEQIGEGFFGKVYKGMYFPSAAGVCSENLSRDIEEGVCQGVPVAVKKVKRPMLDQGYDNDIGLANVDLLKEADAIAQLSHDNILQLVGIVQPASGTMWMVMEYMEGGDLATWLRESNLALDDAKDGPMKSANRSVNVVALEKIATQIAAGLAYLAEKKYVHRDLACRNCLVGKDHQLVKISDFGLARRVYSQGYYKAEKSKTLPVRWMAPESILFGEFTHASDIWAYGVVLWEIFSMGKQPYYGYNGEDVIKKVTTGKLLEIPKDTPEKFASIMKRCWEEKADIRIKAQEVVTLVAMDVKNTVDANTGSSEEDENIDTISASSATKDSDEECLATEMFPADNLPPINAARIK